MGRDKNHRKAGGEMNKENKSNEEKVESEESASPGPISYNWRKNLKDREEMLKYLKTGEGY